MCEFEEIRWPPQDQSHDVRPGEDRDVDLASLPRCSECGYILYRLARMQCPECGTPVRMSDLYPKDEFAEVVRQARHDRIMAVIGGTCWAAGLTLFAISCFGRHWALEVCLVAPLMGVSAIMMIRAIWLGEPLHGLLLAFGIVWLIVGGATFGVF